MIRSTENYRNENLAEWDLGIHSKEISCPGDEGSKFLQTVATHLTDHSITCKTKIMFRLLKCLLSVLLKDLVNCPQHPSTEVRRDIQDTEVKPHIFINHSIWIIRFASCLPCTLSNHPSQLTMRMDGIKTTDQRIMKITKTLTFLMWTYHHHHHINNWATKARISTNIYVKRTDFSVYCLLSQQDLGFLKGERINYYYD